MLKTRRSNLHLRLEKLRKNFEITQHGSLEKTCYNFLHVDSNSREIAHCGVERRLEAISDSPRNDELLQLPLRLQLRDT